MKKERFTYIYIEAITIDTENGIAGLRLRQTKNYEKAHKGLACTLIEIDKLGRIFSNQGMFRLFYGDGKSGTFKVVADESSK